MPYTTLVGSVPEEDLGLWEAGRKGFLEVVGLEECVSAKSRRGQQAMTGNRTVEA